MIYDTAYSCESTSEDFLHQLSQVTFESLHDEESKNESTFAYLLKNEFIPYNIQYLKSDSKQEFRELEISNPNHCKVWYKQDDEYEQPKINVKVVFRTLDLKHREDPKSKIFKSMWASLVRENLREISYCAELANISYYVSTNSEGVTFGFHGFNDGLQNFIKDVLRDSVILGQDFKK